MWAGHRLSFTFWVKMKKLLWRDTSYWLAFSSIRIFNEVFKNIWIPRFLWINGYLQKQLLLNLLIRNLLLRCVEILSINKMKAVLRSPWSTVWITPRVDEWLRQLLWELCHQNNPWHTQLAGEVTLSELLAEPSGGLHILKLAVYDFCL